MAALMAAMAVVVTAFVASPAVAMDMKWGDDLTTIAPGSEADGDAAPDSEEATATEQNPAEEEAAVTEPTAAEQAATEQAPSEEASTSEEDTAPGEGDASEEGTPSTDEPSVQVEAVPDGAAPAADAAEPDVGVQAVEAGSITVDFNLKRVTLSNGAVTGATHGTVSNAFPTNIDGSATNVFSVKGNLGDASAHLELTVVYKVAMAIPNAPDEDYWVKIHVYTSGFHYFRTCDVTTGDPRAGGVQIAPTPFTCFARTPGSESSMLNQTVTVSIDLNRWAEASGTVQTERSVSLDDGKYLFLLPFAQPGATTVPQSSQTTFATVWREPDRPIVGAAAKVSFTYRILDNGKPTRYWVVGWVNKPRSATSGGKCMIIDQDPWGDNAPVWDDLPNDSTAPYACADHGTSPDSDTLDVTFTVSTRDVTVIPASQRPLQAQLIKSVCEVDMKLCDLRLANAEKAQGAERPISSYINNRTDKPMALKFETKSSQSTTTSFGTEVTVGVEGGIGAHFKLEVKATYGWDIENTTETSEGFDYEIPPNRQGWVVGSPPMIHASGDIYVNQNNRLYLLQGVSATFADKSGQWIKEGVDGPLAPRLGEDPVVEIPSTSLNPVAAPISASGSARQASLATTGVATEQLVWSAMLAIALLGGGALLFVPTHRRRRKS
ncbi:hypothetical protein DC31_03655 [Microbacterium sp. CH12i]|nr:hypothetical protein DC31_03655 [Microbacterium sp. CH12i]